MKTVADELGVPLNSYRSVEVDEYPPKEFGLKLPKLGSLKEEDILRILRRRSGKTVKELAEEVGCCQWWYRQMEMGRADSTRLREFWKLG